MKLVNYNGEQKLNTISGGVQATGNELAFGGNQQGLKGVINAIDNINAQMQKRLDEDLNIAYMNAETDYKNRISYELTNKESGILHKELDGAANATQLFNEAESNIRQDVFNKLPNNDRLRERFLQMVEKDYHANNMRVQVHERSEREKYKDVTFNNNVKSSEQIAVLGYNNPNIVANSLSTLKDNINTMYGDRGEEFVKAKYQEVADRLGGAIIDETVTRNDITAGPQTIAVLREMGVSEGILSKAAVAIDKVNTQQTIDKRIVGDVDTYGEDDASIEKGADAFIASLPKAGQGGNLNVAALDSAVNEQLGKPYLLGGDGGESTDCGKFTLDVSAKAGVTLNYRTADGQYLQAEQEGKLIHDISQAQKGDLVFWHVPSNEARWATSDDPSAVNSDDKAYKGVTHVGVYMGDGKVAQAGSGGVSIVSTDIYPIVGVGKFSGSAKGYTDGELLQKREEYMKAYKLEVSKRKKVRAEELARQKKAIELQYLEMQKNGATNAELANFLDRSTAGNEELTLAFGGVRNRYIEAERREVAAQNNAQYKATIVQMIANNVPPEQILKYAAENGSLSMEEQSSLNKELNDMVNGTGDYSVDLSPVKHIMDDAVDNLKDSQKGIFKQGFRKDFAAWYRKATMENGGEPPSYENQIWYANEIAGQKVIQTTQVNHFWERGDNYQSNVALATIRGAGFIDYQPIIGDDGGHYVRMTRPDGTFEDYEESDFHRTFGDNE
nr:MAG TPA: NlpC/P60 family [Caudoviricetes sp.]